MTIMMNTMKRILLLAAVLCLASRAGMQAQDYEPVPVKVSTESAHRANNITFRNGNEETEMIFSAAKYFNSVKNKESVAQSLKDVMQTMNNFVNSTTAYISRT